MSKTEALEIRPPREDEFPEAVEVSCTAFGEEFTEADVKVYREGFQMDRALCAFADGRMVGTSAVNSMELTVAPGSCVPMGGLTWIAVLPTHRRRGILQRLMVAQLEDIERRGEPVSALIASEGGIYGRFGYGPATSVMGFSLDRAAAAFARPVKRTGRLVLLGSREASEELPKIYDGLRRLLPGEVNRPRGWWTEYLHDPEHQREGAGRMFHAKHETVLGAGDGYASYRVKEKWAGATPKSVVKVLEVMAATTQVYAELWDYLVNIDLTGSVETSRGRVDEPLRWLLSDPRALRVDGLNDYLWVRLVDVPGALAAREYQGAGRLVLELSDPLLERNTGRVLLSIDSGAEERFKCARTDMRPDLSLDVGSLGAAYLGGVTFSSLATAGRVQELRPGALRLADALFFTGEAPYCVTMF